MPTLLFLFSLLIFSFQMSQAQNTGLSYGQNTGLSYGQSSGLSPVRPAHLDYRLQAPQFQPLFDGSSSVYRSRRSFDQAEWNKVPSVDEIQLRQFFSLIKSKRVLVDKQLRQRRLPWYFPDSGCFARAEVMSTHLENMMGLKSSKIFAFGNLKAKTAHHQSGWIYWWYHVAPVVRVGNEILVLDPSINFDQPIPVQQWLTAMNATPEIAICNTHSYDPNSDCNHLESDQLTRATQDLSGFLDLEWNRLVELGRDPQQYLFYNSGSNHQ